MRLRIFKNINEVGEYLSEVDKNLGRKHMPLLKFGLCDNNNNKEILTYYLVYETNSVNVVSYKKSMLIYATYDKYSGTLDLDWTHYNTITITETPLKESSSSNNAYIDIIQKVEFKDHVSNECYKVKSKIIGKRPIFLDEFGNEEYC